VEKKGTEERGGVGEGGSDGVRGETESE